MTSKAGRPSQTFSPSTNISELLNSKTKNNGVERDAQKDAEFAAKKWVWLPNDKLAFVKGFVVSKEPNNQLRVRCSDDSVSIFALSLSLLQGNIPADCV